MEASANLGLCQLNDCLATSSIGEAVMISQTALNWRFENGLLHAVDTNGNVSDRCLGPGFTNLDSDHDAPYGLILQDCPQTNNHGNIFSHESGVSTRTEQVEKEYSLDDGRHMRFMIAGDGHIQSLAPVDGRISMDNSGFCMSSMKFGSVGEPSVYLVPCRDGRDEQLFTFGAGSSFDSFLFNWKSLDGNSMEFGYQLGYDGTTSSSNVDVFESLSIKVTSYQDRSFVSESALPGGSSPDSGTLALSLSDLGISENKEHEQFQAQLMGMPKGELDSRLLADTFFILTESSMPASGVSTNGDNDINGDSVTNAWHRIPGSVKTFFWFLCIMFFYVIVKGAINCFCPNNRTRQRLRTKRYKEQKELRLSELTAATVEEARRCFDSPPNSEHSRSTISVEEEVHRANIDMGGWEQSLPEPHSNSQRSRSLRYESPPTSAHSRSTLFRITEELDPEDIESITIAEDTDTTASSSGEILYSATRSDIEKADE